MEEQVEVDRLRNPVEDPMTERTAGMALAAAGAAASSPW